MKLTSDLIKNLVEQNKNPELVIEKEPTFRNGYFWFNYAERIALDPTPHWVKRNTHYKTK